MHSWLSLCMLYSLAIYCMILIIWEHEVVRWLKRYATSRKVAVSSPGGFIEFLFNFPNPSSRALPSCLLTH
jgi:hypothetical protein